MVKIVNTTTADITVIEIRKKTTLAPNAEVEIDPTTIVVKIK